MLEASPILNGRQVSRISANVVEGSMDDTPAPLDENAGHSFQGAILLGMGFTFDDVAAAKGEAEPPTNMERLVAANERNGERIKPYIGGEEINNSPTHAHHRHVIDFEDFPLRRDSELPDWLSADDRQRTQWLRHGVVPVDYDFSVAADWPELLEIIERRVKPERAKIKREARRRRWWRFGDRQPGLSRAIRVLPYVLAISRVSPQFGIARLPARMVFADSTVIFAFPNLAPFAVLQSRIHEIWARFFSSTLEDRLRYAPSDCFESFPFPQSFKTDPALLEAAGHANYDHRAALMIAHEEGMTKTYNRFHDRGEQSGDIRGLRELHAKMDRAVLAAYGWHDLAERAEPVFLDQSTVGVERRILGKPEDEEKVRVRQDRLLQGFEKWAIRYGKNAPHYPGTAYILLHSLSHALMQEIALDCGYPASSLKERVYAHASVQGGTIDHCGLLIYTASAGAQGTLGGLVSIAPRYSEILAAALRRAEICSNDPICADHEPDGHTGDRATHGAACHGCLLVAETSCEARNLFLDRALLVETMSGAKAAFFPKSSYLAST
jgi:hypothetical protein